MIAGRSIARWPGTPGQRRRGSTWVRRGIAAKICLIGQPVALGQRGRIRSRRFDLRRRTPRHRDLVVRRGYRAREFAA